MQEYTNDTVEITDIPQIISLEFRPMAKNYPALNTLETLFIWLIFGAVLSVAVYIFDKIDLPYWIYLIVVGLSSLSLIYSYTSASAKGYVLRDNDLIYKEGLIWKKQTGVSFKRVQHIDITHGPMERKFAIATIKFFTAGGSLADLKISGLPKDDAETLRSHILKKTGSNDE
jgi:membrane protein YdbS with pleckstrin-like domain